MKQADIIKNNYAITMEGQSNMARRTIDILNKHICKSCFSKKVGMCGKECKLFRAKKDIKKFILQQK